MGPGLRAVSQGNGNLEQPREEERMIDYIQVQDEAPQKEEETLKNSDIQISTEGKTSEDYNYS